MPTYSADQLRGLACDLLERAGVPREDALVIADTMVAANLRGVDSHGIAYLGVYLRRIRTGATNSRARLKVTREGPAYAMIDGDNGFGAVTAVFAMRRAIERSRDSGVYLSLCYNNTTFGAAFYYSLMAARAGKIGFSMCNAPPSMAPWGGKKPLIGTNPISVSFPGGKHGEIVLDMATSAAAKSKIYLAKEKGTSIPEGWALDKEGRPTTDPEKALAGGLLMPLGGPKGYGLALTVDLLCGALSGAGACDRVQSLHHALDRGQNVSFLVGAIDPECFGGLSALVGEAERVGDLVHSCPPADGYAAVMLPGEPEASTERKRLVEGIPVPEPVIEEIKAEARHFNAEVRL